MLVSLSPAPAWAAEGGLTGEFFWQVFSFVLLVILLSRFLKKPARAYLAKRREEIRTSLEQVIQKEAISQAQLEEWEGRLAGLDREIAELKENIRREGEEERRRIIQRAEEERGRIREQAQLVGEQEVTKAQQGLKKEMIDLSVNLAERLLKEAIRPEDQERLVKEFVEKVRDLR